MKQRGNTLAATLVVVVILMLLAIVFFYGVPGKAPGKDGGKSQTGRADGLGTTIPGAARWRAKDEECRSNIDQVRQFLQVHASSGEDEKPPQTLDDAQVPKSIRECPIGHEPYQYDPATGKVTCPHPGHEKF